MGIVAAHLQQYWIIYAIAGACLLPVLYATRRYSMPVLQWGVELAFCWGMLHVIIHYFIQMVKWFKLNTMMYWHDKIDPGWQTPLKRFWDRAEYNPEWLFYLEVLAAVLMVAAMIRYRPMKVQRIRPRREETRKGEVPASVLAKYGKTAGRPRK